MTLYQSYKKNLKRYVSGGDTGVTDPEEEKKRQQLSQNIGFGATLASGIIDATATPDPTTGRQSTGSTVASSALKGAAAGASLGPVGAGIGGVVGAVTGFLGANREKKAAMAALQSQNDERAMAESSRSAAMLAGNPSLLTGYKNSGYFGFGGPLGNGDPKKPEVFTSQEELDAANAQARGIATRRGLVPGEDTFVGRKIGDRKPTWDIDPSLLNSKIKPKTFNVPSYVQRSDIQTADGNAWYTDPQTGDVVDIDMNVLNQPRFRLSEETKAADLAARATALRKDGGSIHIKPENRGKFTASANRAGMEVQEFASHVLANKEDYSSTQVKRANFAKNAAGWKKEYGGKMGTEAPLSRMYMTGGHAKSLSSDGVEMVGNSHAEGGIQIPGTGAEVEDNETMMGDYVFSDKLGFADIHKKLSKAKGIIEKKPATHERVNSIKLLAGKENQLKMAQEYIRSKQNLA